MVDRRPKDGKKQSKSQRKTTEMKFVWSEKDERVAQGIDALTRVLRDNGLKTLLHDSEKRDETAITKQSLYEFALKNQGDDIADALMTLKKSWVEAAEEISEVWNQTEAMGEWEAEHPIPEDEDQQKVWKAERKEFLKSIREEAIEQLIAELPDEDFAWR